MSTSQVRELALVVGVATAGALVTAVIVIGPVALADTPSYPPVIDLHAPPEPQP